MPHRTLNVGDRLASVTRQVTMEKMVEFERVVWDRGQNSHTDTAAAAKDGLTKPLASGQNQMAFLHELLERNFGDSWVYGGKIAVRYIHPVHAGDEITAHGVVTELSEAPQAGRVALQVWCENQAGQKTAVGTASAGQPSELQSWMAAGKEPS